MGSFKADAPFVRPTTHEVRKARDSVEAELRAKLAPTANPLFAKKARKQILAEQSETITLPSGETEQRLPPDLRSPAALQRLVDVRALELTRAAVNIRPFTVKGSLGAQVGARGAVNRSAQGLVEARLKKVAQRRADDASGLSTARSRARIAAASQSGRGDTLLSLATGVLGAPDVRRETLA